MRDYTLVVAGFGRCGSSLVMQMLHAGGFPTTGEYPAFEDERFSTMQQKAPTGTAVKILDPHEFPPPPGNYRWIWIDRDPRQQAKSIVKFLRHFVGIQAHKGMVPEIIKSYQKDRAACMEVIHMLGGPILVTKFEHMINYPLSAAVDIGIFAGCPNRERMASVVRRRSPMCLPTLLELELLKELGVA